MITLPKSALRHPAVLANAVTLTLRGICPAKKNAWRGNGRGGVFIDEATASQIEALTTQARIQWGSRPAVEHSRMEFRFFVTARRKDRDNLYQTCLDVLVKARVLVNDNPVSCNGTHVLHPVTVVGPRDERAEIAIEECGC